MAILLNLETATTNCSVGIAENGRLIALKEYDSPKYSHAEQLHVFIGEVLSDAGIEVQALSAVAVSKGPGSYTGLRIGVSAAKGLCFSLDVPLISVPTLESLAHQMVPNDFDVVIPVLDARRMEVYSAVFDKNYQQLRETRAQIIDEEAFGEYVDKGKICLVGNGAAKCSDMLKHPNFEFISNAVPSAKEMAVLSHKKYLKGDFEDVAYFEPYYLKDFMVAPKKG